MFREQGHLECGHSVHALATVTSQEGSSSGHTLTSSGVWGQHTSPQRGVGKLVTHTTEPHLVTIQSTDE